MPAGSAGGRIVESNESSFATAFAGAKQRQEHRCRAQYAITTELDPLHRHTGRAPHALLALGIRAGRARPAPALGNGAGTFNRRVSRGSYQSLTA